MRDALQEAIDALGTIKEGGKETVEEEKVEASGESGSVAFAFDRGITRALKVGIYLRAGEREGVGWGASSRKGAGGEHARDVWRRVAWCGTHMLPLFPSICASSYPRAMPPGASFTFLPCLRLSWSTEPSLMTWGKPWPPLLSTSILRWRRKRRGRKGWETFVGHFYVFRGILLPLKMIFCSSIVFWISSYAKL